MIDAVRYGRSFFVQGLLQKLSNDIFNQVNKVNTIGETPLNMAVKSGFIDITQMLVENGANVLECVGIKQPDGIYSNDIKGGMSLLFSLYSSFMTLNDEYKKADEHRKREIEAILKNCIKCIEYIIPIMVKKDTKSINWKRQGGFTILDLVKDIRTSLEDPIKNALQQYQNILIQHGAKE